jgi:hypothetical protein
MAACAGKIDQEDTPQPPIENGTLDPSSAAKELNPDTTKEPPQLGLHMARGSGGPPSGGGGTSNVNMTWHNGSILTSTTVTAIFWGSRWSNATFVGDKFDGIDSFYSGLGGTSYAGTSTEYSGTNGQVGTAVSYNGHIIDTSAAPRSAPRPSAILAEVCKEIKNPVANGYYPVYTDTPRGNTGYCAWHSYSTCGGVPVQFGFFFELDGDPGCDPQDTSNNHSQGLAALANVSGHEYSETATDPRNGGWYDSSNGENGDKCAWTWPSNVTTTFANGSIWKIQGNWSNAAYTGKTGYPNRSGQAGCIGGL